MSPTESRRQRVLRLRQQARLAAARLRSHRGRCATCGRGSGLYDGLCVLGIGLRRELEAARRVRDGLTSPV